MTAIGGNSAGAGTNTIFIVIYLSLATCIRLGILTLPKLNNLSKNVILLIQP